MHDAVLAKVNGVFDFSLTADGDILTEDFFDTAILMSLLCERRAASSEVPASERRRGWIGNESTPDFEIGSKIWIYEQARLTRTTMNGIGNASDEALQWMVDDDIAVSVRSNTSLSNDTIGLEAIIERPNSIVERRFFELWDNTGG